ncbi:MAG TPA: hypothetical protein VFS34_07875 [Thermoanaerobaculia bacterium]|nr:hypothetical protein [Thermoanaerobaculia bacterium]
MRPRRILGIPFLLGSLLTVCGCASHSLSSSNPPPPYAPPSAQPAPPPPAPPPVVPPPPAAPAPANPPAPIEPAAPAGDFGSGSGASYAAPPPMGAPAPSLSPATTEILRLKDAGYTEDFLLNKIRADNTSYRLTVDDLVALRRAGLSETVIDAMLRAGAPAASAAAEPVQPVARHAEFDGLVRQKQGFLGVGSSKKKKVGKFVIDGERINWYQMIDPEDNFSISERNIRELWLNCAPRAGENLCLELCFRTFSGQEGCFRDAGWENGENRQILAMYDYFQKAFPNTFFSKREKKTF